MDVKQVFGHFGGVTKTARALGLAQSSVSEWNVTGIPECRQYQIELATGGKFRADKPALRIPLSEAA